MTHRMMLFSRLLSFHVHRSSVTKLSEKLMSHVGERGGDNPMRTNSEIVPLERVERKKSYVWQYFSKINKSKAKCSICNREFVVKYGNTSCLLRHLTSIHNENLNTSSMMEQPSHSNN
ncbi:hypothetical protein K0M31_018108 [Melipona bicolor]|uniref:BED-type domain-containing protein n=1 Tax=Melipona bicolor TaxID=60889 RepID=A0AA40FD05_9HYME|nr:hypothetical protein K0M31_018108 [Melipona bicolor]